jgi:hypothetical protein
MYAAGADGVAGKNVAVTGFRFGRLDAECISRFRPPTADRWNLRQNDVVGGEPAPRSRRAMAVAAAIANRDPPRFDPRCVDADLLRLPRAKVEVRSVITIGGEHRVHPKQVS